MLCSGHLVVESSFSCARRIRCAATRLQRLALLRRTVPSFNFESFFEADSISIATTNMTNCNVIVNFLPVEIGQTELRNMFQKWPIKKSRVVYDTVTGESKSYGFVVFENPTDANKAVESHDGLKVLNKQIKVSFARPNSEDYKRTNVMIKGLPKEWTNSDLQDCFGKFGSIVTSTVVPQDYHPVGKSAFVRFEKHNEALQAVNQLDGKVLKANMPPINVIFAMEAREFRKTVQTAKVKCTTVGRKPAELRQETYDHVKPNDC